MLFAPGNDRRKIEKAFGLPAERGDARPRGRRRRLARRSRHAPSCANACSTCRPSSTLAGVRINSLASGLADADLDALAEALPRIALITVPMVEGADEIRHVAGRLDELERATGVAAGSVALLAMTETARGVLAAREIAASSARLRTLVFGPADLGRELGVEPSADGFEHLYARSAVVLAARAAGKEGPLDGPYLNLARRRGLRHLRRLVAPARLPGQGRAAPASAADRGRGLRAGGARTLTCA